MATQNIRVNGHVRAREAGRLSVHRSEARRGGCAWVSFPSPSYELLLSICPPVFLRRREDGGREGSELWTREAVGCRVYIRGRFASASRRTCAAPGGPAGSTGFPSVATDARLGSDSNPGLSFRATAPGVNGVFLLPAAATRKSREVSRSGPHVCRGRGAIFPCRHLRTTDL